MKNAVRVLRVTTSTATYGKQSHHLTGSISLVEKETSPAKNKTLAFTSSMNKDVKFKLGSDVPNECGVSIWQYNESWNCDFAYFKTNSDDVRISPEHLKAAGMFLIKAENAMNSNGAYCVSTSGTELLLAAAIALRVNELWFQDGDEVKRYGVNNPQLVTKLQETFEMLERKNGQD